ncbi:MAG: hypothetical protein FWD16_03535, partial [Clostridia bacterium]|nr:hypothetical protein [Clostridia bacterium]
GIDYKFPENFSGHGWLEKRWGPGWSDDGWGFGCGRNDPDVCYITNMGAVYSTYDGGDHWTQNCTTLHEDGTSSTRGLDILNAHCIAVDPNDNNKIICGYADVGALFTDNGGETWRQCTGSTWGNTLYHGVFDEANPGVVWGAWSDHHDMPIMHHFQNATFNKHQGGVCVSYDSGKTWQPMLNGVEPYKCQDVVIDKTSPVDNRTIYMCGLERGVYKSTDNGKTWALFNEGIGPKKHMRAWRFHYSQADHRIYVNFMSDGDSFRRLDPGGVYYLDPGDTRWTPAFATMPGDVNVFNELAIDPCNPQIIYATGRADLDENKNAINGGVWKTTDRGQTWACIFDHHKNCESIRVDNRDSNILYTGTRGQAGVYVSYDAGETWIKSKEFNSHPGAKVVEQDPRDPGRLFVGTGGGSFFCGPVPPKP